MLIKSAASSWFANTKTPQERDGRPSEAGKGHDTATVTGRCRVLCRPGWGVGWWRLHRDLLGSGKWEEGDNGMEMGGLFNTGRGNRWGRLSGNESIVMK